MIHPEELAAMMERLLKAYHYVALFGQGKGNDNLIIVERTDVARLIAEVERLTDEVYAWNKAYLELKHRMDGLEK